METATQRQSRANHGFIWVVALSLLLHIGGIGGAVYAQKYANRGPKIVTSIPVQLVRLGKKRDPKLLPRRTAPAPIPKAPEKTIDLTPDNQATPPKKPQPKPPERAPQLSSAAERLLAGQPDPDLDHAIKNLEDAEGDPNGDPMGNATEATNPASGYALEVSRVLKANYAVPDLIPPSQRRFLEAEVVLFVERDGTISRFEFVRRHPNALFMGALEALLGRIKLPPPPANLAADMRDTGLGVVFKP